MDDFVNLAGLGVQAAVAGRSGLADDSGAGPIQVLVGRPALLADRGQPLSTGLTIALAEAERRGVTAVGVAWDGWARGLILVADAVKPTFAEATIRL